MKKLVFGIGTGRCGTVSLCELLNNQKDSNFTHEEKPVLPWIRSIRDLDDKIKRILSRKEHYVGDIAFYYLPYIEYILANYPQTKIICLKRDRQEVVKSYLKKTRGRNHWVNHNGFIWSHCEWDKCYPTYNNFLKRNAIKKYWEKYYSRVEELILKYPRSIMIIDMYYALNTEDGILEMLNFIGIEENNSIIKKDIKKNELSYKF
ncbi:Sulfotransferase domain-containing protein [Fodinibius roseus]|uniref:Sulfotransferase domain-containing protein n=1 Tax=Fodinibius roseus TaxID=1194090 RepID=A0A1M4STN2_9BACT|nr:sulfotransferase [Fodinibius roseus]SHE35525.1 Sulfotransferase domain-containing protein [Fodinibius roseus]